MLDDIFTTESDENGNDAAFMRAALAEARRALGRVAPNPAVGAVVVRDGAIITRGATQPPPGAHAEIVALRQAGEAARGGDLYVTLEPCCTHGRTPPCTDALIAAGIKRVVFGTLDPNPAVDGKGVWQLRQAGIDVETCCLGAEARAIVAGFSSRIKRKRPRTLIKYAMTLDGKIATRTGHSRWISGPQSRELSHIMRDRADAIMAGSGTITADNPRLTTRLPDELAGYGGSQHPCRIVIDGQLRTPPDAAVLTPGAGDPPIIYCTARASRENEQALVDAGAIVHRTRDLDGYVDLEAVLADLGERGVNELFVEGGGGLIGALLDAGLVDEVVAIIGPMFVGGNGPSPVAGHGVATMPEAFRLIDRRMRFAGDDIMIHGRVEYPEAANV